MRRAIVFVLGGAIGCDGGEAAPRCEGDCPVVRIAWAGDTMLGDAAQPLLDAHGYGYPFEHVADVVDADLLVVNAEGPITTISEPHDPDQAWSYHAHPPAAEALAMLGVDAVSLANNHFYDRGSQGAIDTVAHLDAHGVLPFGGGLEPADAFAPWVADTPAGAVAIVGLGMGWGRVPAASEHTPGIATVTADDIALAVARADEAGAALRVAFVHWGANYSSVSAAQRDAARELVAAGFDLVIGHGAHVPQIVERIDGVPVLYSLGNFAFGTPGRFDDAHPGYGIVAHTVIDPAGIATIELRCILTDNDIVAYQPRPCPLDEARAMLTALGPDVILDGEVGSIAGAHESPG